MDSWELTKENIRPLSTGRPLGALEQDEKEVLEKKREFESALRTYIGDDKIDPWYKYILWVEHTFPSGGKRSNLEELLEKCISEFKDDPTVSQDKRYLDVWIKYANINANPLEIYRWMATENVCTKQANFYVVWSWELEKLKNFKDAEKVYHRGKKYLEDQEQLSFLESKHAQFQARVMRKMIEKGDESQEALSSGAAQGTSSEDKRTVFASLHGHGKHREVGSVRTGGVVKSDGPGRIALAAGQAGSTDPVRNKPIAVFQDPENASSDGLPVGAVSGREKTLPIHRERNRENEIGAQKWTEAKIGKKSQSIPVADLRSRQGFEVFEDEPSKHDASDLPKVIQSTVLSERKAVEVHKMPFDLIENSNQQKFRPMYCKHHVYQGVMEFSLEELRAVKYRRLKAKEELNKLEEERSQLIKDQVETLRSRAQVNQEQKNDIENFVKGLKEELDRRVSNQAQIQNEDIKNFVKRQKEELIQWMNEQICLQAQELQKYKDDVENFVKRQKEDLARWMSEQMSCQVSTIGPAASSHSICKTPKQATAANLSVQPSPTVNTKEALSVVQKMWGKSDQSIEAEVAPKSSAPFQVYCDEPEDSASVQLPVTKPSFQVYCDDPAAVQPQASENVRTAPPQADPVFDNFPAPSRQKRGLKVRQEEPSPLPQDDNVTIQLPTMESFAQMANVASTPFHGRGFIPEPDENTCNVNIYTNKTPAELSPIMEVSKEFYKSTSSSSGASHYAGLTKSHWGNTLVGGGNHTAAMSSVAKTPGVLLGVNVKGSELSSTSGYTADSSERTPGAFLCDKNATEEEKKAVSNKNGSQIPAKEVVAKSSIPIVISKPSHDEEDEDDLVLAMMAEFKKNAGIEDKSRTTPLNPQRRGGNTTQKLSNMDDVTVCDDVTLPLSSRKLDNKSYQGRNVMAGTSFYNESLKMSFVEQIPGEESRSMFEDEKFGFKSMSASVNPDTSVFPTLDLTSGIGQVSQARSPGLDVTEEFPQHPEPFNENLHLRFLSKLANPVQRRHGYKRLQGCVPNITQNSVVSVGDVEFYVMECRGEGGYGKVFKALKKDSDLNPNETIANIDVVLKLQKPPREWEFYICTEIHERLSKRPADQEWFMSIPRCYTYDDGSLFVSEYQSNTLLGLCNQITSLKALEVEPLAVYYTIEMLKIAEVLKSINVIHADIKPENFLLQRSPMIDPNAPNAATMFENAKPALQVIDFGVSIDMQLFPAGTTFVHAFEKKANRSPEMHEGKPWTYQLDYFCIASVAFTLLHGSYMKISKNEKGRYIHGATLRRWWNTDLWNKFFDEFLNIPSCEALPNLREFREQFQNYFYEKYRTKFPSIAIGVSSLLMGKRM